LLHCFLIATAALTVIGVVGKFLWLFWTMYRGPETDDKGGPVSGWADD
jgi:hypothetical protein